jgi:hypothetical protein
VLLQAQLLCGRQIAHERHVPPHDVAPSGRERSPGDAPPAPQSRQGRAEQRCADRPDDDGKNHKDGQNAHGIIWAN